MKEISFTDLHNRFETKIKGKGSPVGVKLLKRSSELKRNGVRPLPESRALCQVLKLSAVYEKTRGVYLDNLDACMPGAYVLGFGMPPADLKQRWIKGFAYSSKRFNDLVKNMEAIPQEKYEAAIFAPLKEFGRLGKEPDAIIMFVNSAQSYLLTMGHFDATGKKTQSQINGHAACEIIPAVAMKKSPWVTIPCGGARSLADSQDDEIWAGMSTKELNAALERLEQIGFKYPAPLNQCMMSAPQPEHPLTNLLSREPVTK